MREGGGGTSNNDTYYRTTEVELQAAPRRVSSSRRAGCRPKGQSKPAIYDFAHLSPDSIARKPAYLNRCGGQRKKGGLCMEGMRGLGPWGINRSWRNGMFIRPHELGRVDWIDDVGGLLSGDTSKTGETWWSFAMSPVA